MLFNTMGIGESENVKHIVLECIHCKQFFSNLNDSDQHVKETHHQIKARFQCPKCEKYFGNYQILQLHLRVHDSEDLKGVSHLESNSQDVESEQSVSDSTDANKTSTSEQEVPKSDETNNMSPINLINSIGSSTPPVKRVVGLTKIRLEDCLRCDECSCIYIDESDYNKHMKNFHRTNSNRKSKQKKGCRSCCKQCNCQGNHPPPMVRNENGNNNLFRFNIKDRWTKMVSCRLNNIDPNCSVPSIKREIKPDPDGVPSGISSIVDYSHLLSQVEVKIKTEPTDDPEDFHF